MDIIGKLTDGWLIIIELIAIVKDDSFTKNTVFVFLKRSMRGIIRRFFR